MKKINIRTFLFSLLVALSIASYIYLTSVTPSQKSVSPTEIEKIENNVSLPDVAFIQKIFKISKQIIDKAI